MRIELDAPAKRRELERLKSVQYTHGEDDLIKRILTYTAV